MPNPQIQRIYDDLSLRGLLRTSPTLQQLGHELRLRGLVYDPTEGGTVKPPASMADVHREEDLQARPTASAPPTDPATLKRIMWELGRIRNNEYIGHAAQELNYPVTMRQKRTLQVLSQNVASPAQQQVDWALALAKKRRDLEQQAETLQQQIEASKQQDQPKRYLAQQTQSTVFDRLSKLASSTTQPPTVDPAVHRFMHQGAVTNQSTPPPLQRLVPPGPYQTPKQRHLAQVQSQLTQLPPQPDPIEAYVGEIARRKLQATFPRIFSTDLTREAILNNLSVDDSINAQLGAQSAYDYMFPGTSEVAAETPGALGAARELALGYVSPTNLAITAATWGLNKFMALPEIMSTVRMEQGAEALSNRITAIENLTRARWAGNTEAAQSALQTARQQAMQSDAFFQQASRYSNLASKLAPLRSTSGNLSKFYFGGQGVLGAGASILNTEQLKQDPPKYWTNIATNVGIAALPFVEPATQALNKLAYRAQGFHWQPESVGLGMHSSPDSPIDNANGSAPVVPPPVVNTSGNSVQNTIPGALQLRPLPEGMPDLLSTAQGHAPTSVAQTHFLPSEQGSSTTAQVSPGHSPALPGTASLGSKSQSLIQNGGNSSGYPFVDGKLMPRLDRPFSFLDPTNTSTSDSVPLANKTAQNVPSSSAELQRGDWAATPNGRRYRVLDSSSSQYTIGRDEATGTAAKLTTNSLTRVPFEATHAFMTAKGSVPVRVTKRTGPIVRIIRENGQGGIVPSLWVHPIAESGAGPQSDLFPGSSAPVPVQNTSLLPDGTPAFSNQTPELGQNIDFDSLQVPQHRLDAEIVRLFKEEGLNRGEIQRKLQITNKTVAKALEEEVGKGKSGPASPYDKDIQNLVTEQSILSPVQIAEKLGIDKSTVFRRLKALNIDLDELKGQNKLAAAFKAGSSLEQLKDEFGGSYKDTVTALKQSKALPGLGESAEGDDLINWAIHQLYTQENLPPQNIKRILNVPDDYIKNLLDEAGVTKRTTRPLENFNTGLQARAVELY